MKDVEFNNSNCGFDGDVVGYLYGELDAAARCDVEGHLAQCRSCMTEFRAIAGARSAVGDWRSAEFAGLALPKIVFREEPALAEKGTWSLWTMVRSLRFAGPSLAVAGLLIVLGFAFFMSSTSFRSERTDGSVPPVAADTPSAIAPTSNQVASAVAETNAASNGALKAKEQRPPAASLRQSELADAKKVRERPTVERSVPKVAAVPSDRSVAKGQKSSPTLNGFEDKEDETLRLEDIFSEIDAS
jgi:hypothetical protein